MNRDKYDEAMEIIASVSHSFWAIVFGILLGTTTVLRGEYIGVVFYVVALFSWIILMVLLQKLKKIESEEAE